MTKEKRYMDENVDILKKNEEIAKKISEIEKNLPSFLNAKDLFEKLLVQSFRVDLGCH